MTRSGTPTRKTPRTSHTFLCQNFDIKSWGVTYTRVRLVRVRLFRGCDKCTGATCTVVRLFRGCDKCAGATCTVVRLFLGCDLFAGATYTQVLR